MSDASKVALVFLAHLLAGLGFEFIDCQTATEHLKRFGARGRFPRNEFIDSLRRALDDKWKNSILMASG